MTSTLLKETLDDQHKPDKLITMRISVRAKTRAGKEYVKKIAEGQYAIAVAEAPEGGRANRAIIAVLAEYFDVAPSSITLLSGATAKQKIFEILL